VAIGLAVLVQLFVIYLAQRGRVWQAAFMMVTMAVFGVTGALAAIALSADTVIFLAIPLLVATITLRIQSIIGIGVLCQAALFTLALLPAPWNRISIPSTLLLATSALLFLCTFIAIIGSQTFSRAFRDIQQGRQELEQSSFALKQVNSELEQRVAARTHDLQQMVDSQYQLTNELQQSLAAQQELNRVIASLSLPIIPIDDHVLVVPIIGTVDQQRLQAIQQSLLQQAQTHRAHTVILDITGVAVIDTTVAVGFAQIAKAAQLIGTRVLIVGIRPEVAQTLAELRIDLGRIRTAATLRDGMNLIPRSLMASTHNDV
jgi:anti-anti-sigma factor